MAAKRPPNSTETTPSGISIDFWDSVGVDGERQQRRYKINGQDCASVTTVLNVLNKPALLDWAANLAKEGKDWRNTRDEAAQRGTDAHDVVIRALLKERVSLKDLDEEVRPFGQAGFRWLRARRPEILLAEEMLAAPSHGIAGRIDLLVKVDGELLLADFKTVTKWAYKWRQKDGVKYETDEKLPPYDENLLQLDLYAICLEKSGHPAPERGLVVRLGPDGTYDETFVDLDPERGLAILGAYRQKAATGAALRAAREPVAA